MELFNKDVIALVLSTQDDWETCCVTEFTKDKVWKCGLNIVTSVKDALQAAEKNGLNIIFEGMLRSKDERKTDKT